MNSKDLFGVAVRIIGIISLSRGFFDLISIILYLLRLLNDSVVNTFSYYTLFLGLIYFFVGLYMLRGGSIIVNYAYPTESKEEIGFGNE